jgi:hypothetical protein
MLRSPNEPNINLLIDKSPLKFCETQKT